MVDGNKEPTLGLGERLRSARKARALTLEQAAFAIRLEAAVLRALEDERYEALGAAVFVRGHLKAYARLLGLSEESVLAAYRAADPGADAPPKVTRELEQPLTTAPGPLAIALAVLVAILAMVLLYVLSGGDEPTPEIATQPATEATTEPTVPSSPLPVLPAAEGPAPAPGAELAPAADQMPAQTPAQTSAQPSAPAPVQTPAEAPAQPQLPAGGME